MQLPASQPRCWEPKAAARLDQVCLWWSHPALRPLHPQPCPCCCGSGPRGRDCVLLECDTPQLASTSGPTGNRSIRAVEGAWMLPRALRPLEGWLSGIGFLVVEGSTDQLPASCFGPLSSWKTCFVCCFESGSPVAPLPLSPDPHPITGLPFLAPVPDLKEQRQANERQKAPECSELWLLKI